MLADRIVSTIEFFDLQDYPLTLLELHTYLLNDVEVIQTYLEENFEVAETGWPQAEPVGIEEILQCLDSECRSRVQQHNGFYHLSGRIELADRRLASYAYGFQREQLIHRFGWLLRHIPFVRGAALGGSQAFGLQKSGSDIDLFIITDPQYLWLARTLVTAVYQIIGKRRHGPFIKNRFCLNHYLAGIKPLEDDRNLYTAMEYLRLRPLAYGQTVAEFEHSNFPWMRLFFPHAEANSTVERQSYFQAAAERLLAKLGADFWERMAGRLQLRRIRVGEFIVATNSELSFHPNNRKRQLFEKFFSQPASNKPVIQFDEHEKVLA